MPLSPETLNASRAPSPVISLPPIEPSVEPGISSQSSHTTDIGTAKAFRAMKKRLKANGFKGEVKPPPESEPMYLFFGAQGKTKAVNCMFDGGCSHAVFKEGIPGKELRGMIKKKGHFT